MTTNTLKPHSVAEDFRPLKRDEYEALLADIRANGVRIPIVVTDGLIVDGVHRHRAATEAGKACPTMMLPKGADPAEYAKSMNVIRRQMSATDKAKYADRKSEDAKQGQKVAQATISAASEEEGVSKDTTKRVRKVRKAVEADTAVPELYEGMGGEEGWSAKDAAAVVKEEPEVQQEAIDRFKDGKSKTLKAAAGKVKDERKAEAAKKAARKVPKSDRFEVYHSDVADLADKVPAGSVDVVVTDPPYDEPAVCLFGEAAEFAVKVLKPGGSLLLMSGGSYLPEVYHQLRQVEGLKYYFELFYDMPGPGTMVHGRKVSVVGKPVIWMTKGKYDGPYIRNVVRSDLKDERINEFHKWGQTVAGGEALLHQFIGDKGPYPAGVVADPMVGGGGFGVAALLLGAARFIGGDIDETAVDTTKGRLHDAASK